MIRPYEPRDRSKIRALCFVTGDKGKSAASFFADGELFADLWTLYYTDLEPQSTWIAEKDGEFAGYLSCCVSENRYAWGMFFYVIPIAMVKAFFRRTLFKKYIWHILFASVRCQFESRTIRFASKKDFKSHLHINLVDSFRGQNIGGQLIEKAPPRVTAGIRADNLLALKFFEKHGFAKLEEQPGFYIPGLAEPRIKAILMGRYAKKPDSI